MKRTEAEFSAFVEALFEKQKQSPDTMVVDLAIRHAYRWALLDTLDALGATVDRKTKKRIREELEPYCPHDIRIGARCWHCPALS